MPSSEPATSITIWYCLVLTQYHQVPTIALLTQYTASSFRNAQLSQLDLVLVFFVGAPSKVVDVLMYELLERKFVCADDLVIAIID